MGWKTGAEQKAFTQSRYCEEEKKNVGLDALPVLPSFVKWLHGLFIGEGKKTLINAAKLQHNRINHPS